MLYFIKVYNFVLLKFFLYWFCVLLTRCICGNFLVSFVCNVKWFKEKIMLGENNLIVFWSKRRYFIIYVIGYNVIIKKYSFYNGKRIWYKEILFYFSNDIL